MRTKGRLPPDLNGSAAMTTVPRSYTLPLRLVSSVFDPLVDVFFSEAVVERLHTVIHGGVGGDVLVFAECPVVVNVSDEIAFFGVRQLSHSVTIYLQLMKLVIGSVAPYVIQFT